MTDKPAQREYYLDSIRASLMLLGIPFHLSLIYSSHVWHVNSATPTGWLTLFNDFIHAFRMQVFFVISGYFSWMLFMRYARKQWWKVRVERVGIPMLTAIPLLTLPQFIMLQYVKGKAQSWHALSGYEKYNTLAWELISHLWFLLVLVILTTLCLVIFQRLKNRPAADYRTRFAGLSPFTLMACSAGFGVLYGALRRLIFLLDAPLLSDGLFNFCVMQTLFYLPFFLLGAQAFRYPALKAHIVTFSPAYAGGALLAFIAYLLNQRYGSGDGWLYETESVTTAVMGVCMVNVVFSLGYRLLNSHSHRVSYLVNASLFIYLVHHPLTLIYGAWITPRIASNTLGFILGLVFIMGMSIGLYELHLRVPLLRFLFSGKPQRPVAASRATAD